MAICPFISGVVLPQGQTMAQEAIVDCKQGECQIWDATNNSCGAKVSPVVPDVHWIRTYFFQFFGITQMGSLVNEFMFQTDVDGNGKIYGKDFKFSDPPPGMVGIQSDPSFNADAVSMTVQEYKDELNNS